MKNLNKLSLILSVGGLSALVFSLSACGDDPAPAPSGGSNAGGSASGATSGGGGAGGSDAAGSSSSGSGGDAVGGSTSGSGGGGAGGSDTGGGGAGGSGGGGGTGGGDGGSAGSGGGGGAPSADCSKWCSGEMGLIAQCAGKLAPAVDTEEKCIANCTKPGAEGAMGLSCWNSHLAFIVGGQSKDTHCPHASGAEGNGQCNVTE